MDPTRNKAARRESTIDWCLLSRARTAEYRRSPRGKCPGLTERQPARGQTVAAGPAPPSRRAISVVAQLKTKTGRVRVGGTLGARQRAVEFAWNAFTACLDGPYPTPCAQLRDSANRLSQRVQQELTRGLGYESPGLDEFAIIVYTTHV
jgi:hypothetical protein